MTSDAPTDAVGPTRERLALLAGASFWIGAGSVFLGWTLLAPIFGVILGVLSLRREPIARRLATTGIVLNGVCLLVYVAALIIVVMNVTQRLAVHSIGGSV